MTRADVGAAGTFLVSLALAVELMVHGFSTFEGALPLLGVGGLWIAARMLRNAS